MDHFHRLPTAQKIAVTLMSIGFYALLGLSCYAAALGHPELLDKCLKALMLNTLAILCIAFIMAPDLIQDARRDADAQNGRAPKRNPYE